MRLQEFSCSSQLPPLPTKCEQRGMEMTFRGHRTASGQVFNPEGMAATHKSLPFGTCLVVENPRSGKRARVTVNNRGPFTPGVVLDLAWGVARVHSKRQYATLLNDRTVPSLNATLLNDRTVPSLMSALGQLRTSKSESPSSAMCQLLTFSATAA